MRSARLPCSRTTIPDSLTTCQPVGGFGNCSTQRPLQMKRGSIDSKVRWFGEMNRASLRGANTEEIVNVSA
jgi:hypothetical protein